MGPRWATRSAQVALVATAVVMMFAVVPAAPAGATGSTTTTTYSATITNPIPPASSFAGSAGGDGWGLALTSTAVYNVFHHDSSQLEVACHLQLDASKCWSTDSKVITDLSNNNFRGSSQPGLYLDQVTGKLYVYTTRTSDATAGVVCIDTTQPAVDPNPFCGFTALSAVGDGGITSIPMQVGSNWYAYNYVSGSPASAGSGSTANTLLCFSLVTFAACGSQPFAVAVGAGNFVTDTFAVPATATIGGKIFVPTVIGANNIIGCFDPGTGTSCTGSWPITLGFSYASSYGSAFPLLNATGAPTGVAPGCSSIRPRTAGAAGATWPCAETARRPPGTGTRPRTSRRLAESPGPPHAGSRGRPNAPGNARARPAHGRRARRHACRRQAASASAGRAVSRTLS